MYTIWRDTPYLKGNKWFHGQRSNNSKYIIVSFLSLKIVSKTNYFFLIPDKFASYKHFVRTILAVNHNRICFGLRQIVHIVIYKTCTRRILSSCSNAIWINNIILINSMHVFRKWQNNFLYSHSHGFPQTMYGYLLFNRQSFTNFGLSMRHWFILKNDILKSSLQILKHNLIWYPVN